MHLHICIIPRSAPAMLPIFLLTYLVRLASSDTGYEETTISPRCRESNNTGLTFTPADGYVGRYIAELCSKRNDFGKEWKLKVSFHDALDKCDTSNQQGHISFLRDHSTNYEYVSEHNCTGNQTACISAPFDLIFSACYSISSSFVEESSRPTYYYFNITNQYTEKFFHENKPQVVLKYFENYVSLTWYPGVPPLVYEINLCNDEESCVYVSDNCTIVERTSIRCDLAPELGRYTIRLRHIAPWISGVFAKQEIMSFDFWRNATSVVSRDGTASWVGVAWWCACAGGALAVVAAGARLVCHSARAKRRRKELMHRLLHTTGSLGMEAEAEGGGGTAFKHVLVLYAREGAAGTRALHALKAALQHVVHGQVFDIYSPEVMAQFAGAPTEWVRSLVTRDDVAVLVVQSPALHCLYSTPLATDTDATLRLVPPLVGRRVVPRVPQYGDALLQYALRLTAERAPTPSTRAYRKYYIATISELGTETLPCIVPYRRYALPAAAPLLLRDLSSSPSPSPSPSPSHLLDNFTRLLAEFVEYAKENPDYLMDELMVVDSEGNACDR